MMNGVASFSYLYLVVLGAWGKCTLSGFADVICLDRHCIVCGMNTNLNFLVLNEHNLELYRLDHHFESFARRPRTNSDSEWKGVWRWTFFSIQTAPQILWHTTTQILYIRDGRPLDLTGSRLQRRRA